MAECLNNDSNGEGVQGKACSDHVFPGWLNDTLAVVSGMQYSRS